MSDFKPDWKLDPVDQIAVALTLALSKHVPNWPGCTDEQMELIAREVWPHLER